MERTLSHTITLGSALLGFRVYGLWFKVYKVCLGFRGYLDMLRNSNPAKRQSTGPFDPHTCTTRRSPLV